MNLPNSRLCAAGRQLDPLRILLLPGWLDSGPEHWQSRWQARHGYQRVVQSDWVWPRRGDWMARLEEVVLAQAGQVLLVAHSLGCHLVAAWAAHSAFTGRVRAAMLVAPPDLEREDTPPNLFNWRPVVRDAMAFRSYIVASDNDPYASLPSTRALAAAWGSDLLLLGPRGHLNGDSGLGDWEQGLELLQTLLGEGANLPPAS